jgi:hypothetical protein
MRYTKIKITHPANQPNQPNQPNPPNPANQVKHNINSIMPKLSLCNPRDLLFLKTSINDYYFDNNNNHVTSLYDKNNKKYFLKKSSTNDDSFKKEIILTKLLSKGSSYTFDTFDTFISFMQNTSNKTDTTNTTNTTTDLQILENIILDTNDNFNSDGVVTFIEYNIDKVKQELYFITESNGDDLYDYVSSQYNQKIPEFECKIFFKQMVLLLLQLHKIGISHGDISTENYCINLNSVKLIDFGLALVSPKSKYFDAVNSLKLDNLIEIINTGTSGNDIICKIIATSEIVGKILYISPERHRAIFNKSASYSAFKDDIYSLGIILFSISTGCSLFDNKISWENKLEMIKDGSWYTSEDNIMSDLSDDCKHLIKNILKLEESRYSLEDILQHPWLNS